MIGAAAVRELMSALRKLVWIAGVIVAVVRAPVVEARAMPAVVRSVVAVVMVMTT